MKIPRVLNLKSFSPQSDINMVFGIVRNNAPAVKKRNEEIHEFYRNFAKFIGQENSVGELTADKTTMETLISEKYNSITREFLFYLSFLTMIIQHVSMIT